MTTEPALPQSLRSALRLAKRTELAATGQQQRREASRASGTLLLAAMQAGWPLTLLAAEMHIKYETARARVQASAQRSLPDVGLAIEPRPRPRRPQSELQQLRAVPAADRDLLTLAEAVTAAGVSSATIRAWRRWGILPRTRRLNRNMYLYARGDLDRVLNAPRYNGHGVSRIALLAALRSENLL